MSKQDKTPGSQVLKGKREKFAQEVAKGDCNHKEAAIKAGYTDNKYLHNYAYKLTIIPAIIQRIEYLRAKTAEKYEITREKVISGILEAHEIAKNKGDAGNMLRAEELLGKTLGIFTDKIIHKDETTPLSEDRIKEAKEAARAAAEREKLRLVKAG